MKNRRAILTAILTMTWAASLQASSGTESASFLDIPVGARPAAMGSAYSALATDAYAPTWNPAGLGRMDSIQIAAQHLAYVQSTSYEYFGFGVPLTNIPACTNNLLCSGSAVGGSVQYFASGDITGLDKNGNPTGSYSSHYAAYNLSFGKALGDQLSLGMTGKLIDASLAGVTANAIAFDAGSLYRLTENMQLAATLMNIGNKLTFLSEGDSLPLAFHVAGAYQPVSTWNLTLEGVYPRTGHASVRMGTEWSPVPAFSGRVGYRTDTLSGLSPLAGLTVGLGLHFWGQELSYAWVPLGDLGDSQYLSLVMRFGEPAQNRRNLIQYKSASKEKKAVKTPKGGPEWEPEQLMELLNENPIPQRGETSPFSKGK